MAGSTAVLDCAFRCLAPLRGATLNVGRKHQASAPETGTTLWLPLTFMDPRMLQLAMASACTDCRYSVLDSDAVHAEVPTPWFEL
jgi:hypothetical protein